MANQRIASVYREIAHHTANWVGKPLAFFLALALILGWVITGPLFHFSDTWQLVINTATTIITFLMVFLIQYAQNRDTQTLHLKLDELIKSIQTARNEMIDLDELTDDQLKTMEHRFRKLAKNSHSDENKRPPL